MVIENSLNNHCSPLTRLNVGVMLNLTVFISDASFYKPILVHLSWKKKLQKHNWLGQIIK